MTAPVRRHDTVHGKADGVPGRGAVALERSSSLRSGRIRTAISEGIGTVIIENQRRRNALSAEMWTALAFQLRELDDRDDVRAVMLRGAGEHFSAGADINDLERILLHPDLPPGGLVTEAEEALASLSKPTIAVISGDCVGGGWELAAACDLRIADDRARIAITPSKLGIVLPLTGIRRLVRLAGPAVAKELLLTAEFVPADRALAMGLLTAVVSAADLERESTAWAARMLALPQLAVRAHKELIDLCAAEDRAAESVDEIWRRRIAASSDGAAVAERFRSSRRENV